MLWTLMMLIMAFALVGNAASMAHEVHASVAGYVICIAFALTVGAANLWLLEMIARAVSKRAEGLPEPQAERRFRLLYLAALVWIFVLVAAEDYVLAIGFGDAVRQFRP